ncbi:hypothetical protein DPV78_010637 [Talaromyces pinophilus]|nr:hypothetical protein DPV78_010637 [Talaromyces pinophilus]
MDSAQSESSASTPKEASTISLRILSPSFESTQRLSLEKLSLSTTVGEVKNLIAPLAPNHPTPEQQRLIYRGRPLLNNNATLESVLESPLDTVHTLHLVLPPGPELSNNIYIAPDSGLRYRHPPGRSPNLNANIFTDTAATATGTQAPGQTSIPPLPGLNNPAQTATPTPVGQSPNGETMRQALEQHRRRAEELNQVVDRARALINTHTSRMRFQNVNIQRRDNYGLTPPPPVTTAPLGTNPQVPNTHAPNVNNLPNQGIAQSLLLARITSQLMLLELEVERGIAPSVGSIAMIRNELYAILDTRYRHPSPSPRGIEVEGLLLRLQNVQARAYQIRQFEHARSLSGVNTNTAGSSAQTTQASEYYLITTPSGEQMILTPPPPPTVPNVPETSLVFPEQQPARNEIDQLGMVPNNVLHNVVRQAVLNQQPARNNNDQFAQNLRRFWLFMRLYFFCYLFTDSNTWERYLFVGLAAIFALFSESNITSRLFSIIVQPIQRHLEGLIHGEPPAQTQQGESNNNEGVNQPEQNRPPTGAAQGGFRRIERAFALFIASLIPGLGERQVEVRNAAEEAARIAREQEQARIDEANAQNEAQVQGESGADQGEAPLAAVEAPGNVEAPEQQQPVQQ